MDISYNDKKEFIERCRDDPVFFVENLLISESGRPYKLEPHQKQFLRCQNPYRMLFWARRLSKSTTIRFDLLHKTAFISSLKALGILPSQSQAIDFGSEIQDMIHRSPLIGELFVKDNITSMLLTNNSRINLATAGGGGVSQLGRGARFLFFDEAQQIPSKVYGFLIPILRGQPGQKWQVFSGTPLGKIGEFFEVYENAQMIIEKTKVQKIEENIADDAFIVFQRQTAYLDDQGNIVSSGTKRIKIEELKADRKRMNELDFLREYCLQWLDSIGEVFPKELIDTCLDDKLNIKNTSDAECVVGLDIGKMRNNSVLTVGERVSDSKINIIFIKAFPLGTNYQQIAEYMALTLPKKFPNIRKCLMDQTGVGEAVLEQVRKITPYKVEGYNFAGGEKKKSLVESGVLAMEQGKVKLIFNQKLYHELLSYKREISEKTNKILYTKPGGGSDDYVDSLLLCIAAHLGTVGSIGSFNVVSIGNKIFESIRPQNKVRAPTSNILGQRGIYK